MDDGTKNIVLVAKEVIENHTLNSVNILHSITYVVPSQARLRKIDQQIQITLSHYVIPEKCADQFRICCTQFWTDVTL